MKKLTLLIMFLFVFSSFALTATAQNKTVSKKDAAALTRIYQEFDDESKKLETKAIEKYLSEDYSIEQDKVKLNKKQVLERVKTFISIVKEISQVNSKIEKISLANGNYILEVVSTTKGKMTLPDGKITDFSFTSKSTDFWKKDKQLRWKEFKQIARAIKTIIDGKEVSSN